MTRSKQGRDLNLVSRDATPVAAQDLQPFSSFGIQAQFENAEAASVDIRPVLNKVDYKRLASCGYGFGRDYTYGSCFRAIGKY